MILNNILKTNKDFSQDCNLLAKNKNIRRVGEVKLKDRMMRIYGFKHAQLKRICSLISNGNLNSNSMLMVNQIIHLLDYL